MRLLVRHSITALRFSLGAVFLGFGLLKFFPGLSPAADLATQTTSVLTFGLVPAGVSILLVATLECVIGLGLISGKFMRLVLLLLGFQMLGAMSPLLLFAGPFHAPTLEAQYVIKDVILIAAGLVIGATLHGGRIVSERVRRAEDYRRYIPNTQSSPAENSPCHRPKRVRILERIRSR